MKTSHISCCHMSWMPNYVSNYRTDTGFKLCLITGGHVLWEIEGTHYDVRKDDVILFDNTTLRRFTKIHGPEALSMQIIMFSPDVLKNTNFLYMFHNTPLCKTRIIHGNEIQGLIPLLNTLGEECQKPLPYRFDITCGLFNAALALIARHTGFEYTKPTKNDRKIRQAILFIDRNYTAPLSLTQLAARANMTPSSFSKAFLKCTGVGVTQYIMRRRIEYAIEQLEHTNKNVLDIALDCGFNTCAAFYQSFKKITGSMPKNFRKT